MSCFRIFNLRPTTTAPRPISRLLSLVLAILLKPLRLEGRTVELSLIIYTLSRRVFMWLGAMIAMSMQLSEPSVTRRTKTSHPGRLHTLFLVSDLGAPRARRQSFIRINCPVSSGGTNPTFVDDMSSWRMRDKSSEAGRRPRG